MLSLFRSHLMKLTKYIFNVKKIGFVNIVWKVQVSIKEEARYKIIFKLDCCLWYHLYTVKHKILILIIEILYINYTIGVQGTHLCIRIHFILGPWPTKFAIAKCCCRSTPSLSVVSVFRGKEPQHVFKPL